ncbi:MAG: carbohydrate porin [Cyanobacteria bacterium J06632_3]
MPNFTLKIACLSLITAIFSVFSSVNAAVEPTRSTPSVSSASSLRTLKASPLAEKTEPGSALIALLNTTAGPATTEISSSLLLADITSAGDSAAAISNEVSGDEESIANHVADSTVEPELADFIEENDVDALALEAKASEANASDASTSDALASDCLSLASPLTIEADTTDGASATPPPIVFPESLAEPFSEEGCATVEASDQLASESASEDILLAGDPAPEPAPGENVRYSHELNLLAVRALRKPVTNKVLDTGVFIQGIRPRADDSDFWNRSFLTGNWGGFRDELYDNGIDLVYGAYVEAYSNVSGGIDQGTSINQIHIASGDFYTDRLGWWDGGFFHLTTSWLEGDSLGRNRVGSLNTAYFADPPASGFRLFEAFYSHDFADRTVNLRVGRIYPFVKIAASQTAGLFTNTSFDYPTFLGSSPSSGHSAAFGAATWGVQLGYNPSRSWNFIAHVMDGFDDPSGGFDNRDGLEFQLSGDEGAEGIFEVLHRTNQNPGDTGLPGYYRLGLQGHTGNFNQLGTLADATPTQQRGNYAFYATAEQMLYRESPDPSDRTQGLNGFAKIAFAPEQSINLTDFHVSGGLAYEGLFPSRDRDVVGLGIAHTAFSDGARALDRAIGSTSERNAETVVELTYAAEIAPWWLIVGSAQHIFNPGGYSSVDDATVLGISSRFSF